MLTLADLAELAREFPETPPPRVREFAVGGRLLKFNTRAAIMGVINRSADSWYRESVCLNTDMAIERLGLLAAQGADLIDIGAESTLPNAARANTRQQLETLTPILTEAQRRKLAISVETYQPVVAEKCLELGAAVINLTGHQASQRIFRATAAHQAAIILCYVQGRHVRAVDDLAFAGDPVAAMYEYFSRQMDKAVAAGVEKIFIDPGLGFYYRNLGDGAERVRHQMRMLLRSQRLRTLGFPVCQALPHAFEYFAAEVRSAEPFFAVLAALGRTDLLRTHEVPRVRAVLGALGCW